MKTNLVSGSYVYHREGRFAGKFFCIPHSTENALEKYKFKTKVIILIDLLKKFNWKVNRYFEFIFN